MNNRKTAGSIQLILTLIVIAFLCLFICSITIEILKINWLQWFSGCMVFISAIYFITGGFYYIELDKIEDHFEIKYYNTFPFAREFKMFRIPLQAFIKYEISGNKYFRRKLRLFQMSASQVAKYPPIYITALSQRNEIEMVNIFEDIKNKS